MIWLALPAIAATAYYVLAIVAALRWPKSPTPYRTKLTPISILKPLRGRDPGFYDAILSHARQDYPEFEILFGVSDPNDDALPDIERLAREFPAIHIAVHKVSTNAANVKAGVLKELAKHARYPLLLVNDSDIAVKPGYLRAAAAPLEDPKVGMVSCLYKGRAESHASRFEALGIATEFVPSVLVARLLGVAEFALGSTMVFRAEDLRAVGGFEAIEDYLADDYQLGLHIHRLGRRIEFASTVVETDLGAESWPQTWRHQLRWSRTIRVSRASGYYGYVITHATFWALVALAAGQWWIGCAALVVRLAAGAIVTARVLEDRSAAKDLWLFAARDLFGLAVWVCGLFGTHVEWRGRRLELHPDGRLTRPEQGGAGELPAH